MGARVENTHKTRTRARPPRVQVRRGSCADQWVVGWGPLRGPLLPRSARSVTHSMAVIETDGRVSQ